MWKYIKAAFGVKQRIPLLGHVPINAIALPTFAALSLLHPAFLLIGLGFELALLSSLAFSSRFREIVDRPLEEELQQQDKNKREELIQKLDPEHQEKFLKLQKRINQTKQSYEQFRSPGYITEPNLKSLHSLAWVYLKLLFAKTSLTGFEGEQNALQIETQINTLQSELKQNQSSSSVRKSKEATLEILQKRLKHYTKRKETLEEISADLTRIEAQVELARDNAKLQAKPEAVSVDLDLASETIQSVWYYGEADETIQELDDEYLSTPLTQ